jgi:hypothetical protein
MKEFLIWLKENHWHLYKDGTWYTTSERSYMQGKQRKYYTEDEVIELYNKTK